MGVPDRLLARVADAQQPVEFPSGMRSAMDGDALWVHALVEHGVVPARSGRTPACLATPAAPAAWRPEGLAMRQVRISAIVDACFRLIVDGKTAPSVTRWGSAQVLV